MLVRLEPLPEWKRILKRAWSIRIALLLGALNGLYGAFDVFKDLMPPYAFLALNMALSIAVVAGRLTKQKGVSDE